MDDTAFEAKPMILLVGQYSTGKTTFIRHLLGRDYPGMRIGPEPTTDGFIVVGKSDKDDLIPGNACVTGYNQQYWSLSAFGNKFLGKFQCSMVNSSVLEGISIVDTPGILSGEKQRLDRGYDFTGVAEWFAQRADRILLLFDAHKLDISDEFKRTIEALKRHDYKIRIILNKADTMTPEELLDVKGALMWNLGKVLETPEISRVYVGSFWDHPIHNSANKIFFEKQHEDLLDDLRLLPRNPAMRTFNDLIKRARLAKVHAYILSTLYSEMPYIADAAGAVKEDLINNLEKMFWRLQKSLGMSPGDFPDVVKMQEKLWIHDFYKFPKIDESLIKSVDELLSKDAPNLMQKISTLDLENEVSRTIVGGAFGKAKDGQRERKNEESEYNFKKFMELWYEVYES